MRTQDYLRVQRLSHVFFSNKITTMILTSYRIIIGVTIKARLKISGVGVITAARIHIISTAYLRFFTRNFLVTIPAFASIDITSGISKNTPSENMRIRTKVTYRSKDIIGLSEVIPYPERNFTAGGRRYQ